MCCPGEENELNLVEFISGRPKHGKLLKYNLVQDDVPEADFPRVLCHVIMVLQWVKRNANLADRETPHINLHLLKYY